MWCFYLSKGRWTFLDFSVETTHRLTVQGQAWYQCVSGGVWLLCSLCFQSAVSGGCASRSCCLTCFSRFFASSSVNSSLLLVRLQLKCCRLLFPRLRFVISHIRVNSHLLVFLSRFFLSTSVQLKCQPVSTARYLLFPTHKLDSSLRSVSIWDKRKKN